LNIIPVPYQDLRKNPGLEKHSELESESMGECSRRQGYSNEEKTTEKALVGVNMMLGDNSFY